MHSTKRDEKKWRKKQNISRGWTTNKVLSDWKKRLKRRSRKKMGRPGVGGRADKA